MKYLYEFQVEGESEKLSVPYASLSEAMHRLSTSSVHETFVQMSYDERTKVFKLVTSYQGTLIRTLRPIPKYAIYLDGDVLAAGFETKEEAYEYVRREYDEDVYLSETNPEGFIGLDKNNVPFYYCFEEDEGC